jgi:hypothetical protein
LTRSGGFNPFGAGTYRIWVVTQRVRMPKIEGT